MSESAILEKVDGKIRMSKDFGYMCSELRNGRYKLTITKCSEKRTISQNDLMWLWFGCIENETGQPKSDTYLYYCKKFLSRPVNIKGKEEWIYDTSSRLSTKQMSDFMMKIQVDVAVELGITLPLPRDRFYEDFVNEYNR